MPRVSCVECQSPVVVDPQGRCPEGHFVGVSGARVEQAMGNSTPHPDEPEPWVYTILPEHLDDDATPLNGRHAAHAAVGQPREARPVQGPGMVATAPDADQDPSSDALLRELHSLSALDERSEQRETVTGPPPPPPVTEVTEPAPAPEARPAAPPRPDSASIADAFAELSALDSSEPPAAAPRPAPSAPPAPGPTPAQRPAPTPPPVEPRAADQDDFASLFGDPVEPPSPPRTGTRTPDDDHTEASAAPPAKGHDRGTLRAVPSSPPDPSVPGDDPPEAPVEPTDERPARAPAPATAPAATVDLSNFTAKGGAIGRNGRGKGRWSRR